jgi:hypothetical protein
MLQIDLLQFLIQVIGLGAWICLAAAVYAMVEKFLGGPAAREDETRI